jgi:hypothetical protein
MNIKSICLVLLVTVLSEATSKRFIAHTRRALARKTIKKAPMVTPVVRGKEKIDDGVKINIQLNARPILTDAELVGLVGGMWVGAISTDLVIGEPLFTKVVGIATSALCAGVVAEESYRHGAECARNIATRVRAILDDLKKDTVVSDKTDKAPSSLDKDFTADSTELKNRKSDKNI